ncbi:MAG: replication-associated recombination protein A [Candidatus Krumholzibacteriia bacterium]
MGDLFSTGDPEASGDTAGGASGGGTRVPLAERMRPRSFDEFRGQRHLLAPGKILRQILDAGTLSTSLILWGAPGSGKTTLARLMAAHLAAEFVAFSAVTAGVKDVRAVVERARLLRKVHDHPAFLFVDEVHRFNRAQQDAFLPHLENGLLTLIGATTENPSFSVNSALLSRSRVLELHRLSVPDLESILRDAVADAERGLGHLDLEIETGVVERLAELADGDARAALNVLEILAAPAAPGRRHAVTAGRLREAMARRTLGLDRGREEHYNLISALHKSLRGSDPDAGLYWLARLLEGGEDPMYVARRLVRFASEDIGNADPRALTLCVGAAQAVSMIGMPEAELALAQAVVFLASAPKSNRITTAYGAARTDVRERENPPVPLHLRNAPTRLLRDLGRGEGYVYPHDYEAAIVVQDFLPETLRGRHYYEPSTEGFERTLAERLHSWREFRERLRRSERVGIPRQRGAAGETKAPPKPPRDVGCEPAS